MSSPQDIAVAAPAAGAGQMWDVLADRPARDGRSPLVWLGATIRMDRLHAGVMQVDAAKAFAPGPFPDPAYELIRLIDVELGRVPMTAPERRRIEKILGAHPGRYALTAYVDAPARAA